MPKQRWPAHCRIISVAALVGIAGLATYVFGQSFVDQSRSPQLHDTIPAIGRAMMSVCSNGCIVATIFAIVNAIRSGTFTGHHALTLGFSFFVTLTDAIKNAHPW